MSSALEIIDQELAQFGWVESIATNSIINFKSHKSNVLEQKALKENFDLINSFICHMIFYIIFCISLFLYIFIDLGFASFLKKKVTTLIKIKKRLGKTFLFRNFYQSSQTKIG